MKLHDFEADLIVDRGVFSATRIDPGTALLLEAGSSLPQEHGRRGHLLDLGCGYGPIALAVADRNPQATVWALDVNRRALDLVAANAAKLGLSNLKPVSAQEVPADIVFERIWSNPPIRIGKPALKDLLATWLGRLAPGGAARLVVARNLGADSLSSWLESTGMTVTRCSSKRGYRILEVHADSEPYGEGA
jgi:16S rRNA (guanine1207-N2)-methyltransferase